MSISKMDEIEDYFQEQGVYVSGINGRKTHMDSYMTVMDFKVFDKAMENPPFTKEELLAATDDMLYQGYLSPMAGLTARLIRRKFGVPIESTTVKA